MERCLEKTVIPLNCHAICLNSFSLPLIEKEVLREFSNIVVDKTPNAMKVQEYDVKFLDNFEHKSAHESGQ